MMIRRFLLGSHHYRYNDKNIEKGNQQLMSYWFPFYNDYLHVYDKKQ